MSRHESKVSQKAKKGLAHVFLCENFAVEAIKFRALVRKSKKKGVHGGKSHYCRECFNLAVQSVIEELYKTLKEAGQR
jgi:hypothetical protein